MAYSALSAVNLSATGAITLAAKGGDLVVRSRGEGFQQNQLNSDASGALHASGSGGGVAKAAADSSVNLTAGGALGLSAKGNIAVSGGYGEFAIVNAILGSASAALNGGVNLKAGSTLTATAGGALTLQGGDEAGIAAQQLFQFPTSLGTPPPGVVNGTVNTGVSLMAGGAVTLTAGGNVTVAAGNGETLAVGKIRSFPPSPSTSAVSPSSVPTSMHSGRRFCEPQRQPGCVSDRGQGPDRDGRYHRCRQPAGVGLGQEPGRQQRLPERRLGTRRLQPCGSQADTERRRGPDGGQRHHPQCGGQRLHRGWRAVQHAADHTIGDITLTGSANATVHAGLDVVLNNIKGNLTLAGANAGPSGQEMLVDARGEYPAPSTSPAMRMR